MGMVVFLLLTTEALSSSEVLLLLNFHFDQDMERHSLLRMKRECVISRDSENPLFHHLLLLLRDMLFRHELAAEHAFSLLRGTLPLLGWSLQRQVDYHLLQLLVHYREQVLQLFISHFNRRFFERVGDVEQV